MLRNVNSVVRTVILLLAAGGSALALRRGAGPDSLRGEARLVQGRTALEVFLPVGQKVNGCYLNIDGLSGFSVSVNGAPVRNVAAEDCPRSRFGAVELSTAQSQFRPDVNRVELESGEPDHDYWLRLWVSDMAWYIGSLHGHSTYSDGRARCVRFWTS